MGKIVTLLLTLLVSSAHGMVYSWTDTLGVAHYTNKEYEIPVRYRAKAKKRYPEQADITVSTQNIQPLPVKKETPQLEHTPAPILTSTPPSKLQALSKVAKKSPPSANTQTMNKDEPSAAVKKMRAKRNRVSQITDE